MSYFAELDSQQVVKRVIVADSKVWCEQNLGGVWVKASDDLNAAIGYTYDEEQNKFIPPVQSEIELEPKE
jgi:hypothetical protein